MCQLNSPSLKEKKTKKYVEQFVGIDPRGYKCLVPRRTWAETKLQTSELWDIGKKGVKSHFETASRDMGIVDHTN
ncbi:hypothetical protein PCANC_02902 [Puccinia coronata f. sp. avenae]|uniref:Uncharacterized protein n=1 Tax=Puccinia coronata f. sp. avenae TaxID=200324 RepID=A0A2N5T8G5_9BASI|nr:hypothetical protein PCANC_02902 [Puccinia coronata f. sp. avenae]